MKSLKMAIPLVFAASALSAAECGGSFDSFVKDLKQEAYSQGYDRDLVNDFFRNAQVDQSVLKADRSQGHFQKPFVEFSRKLISQNRIDHASKNKRKYANTFSRIENQYGIDAGVLLAFWAFETDFGAFQGNTNTLDALVTLSHDCRRPELFRPQVFAALELYNRNEFFPDETSGAWAGEIGQVQMLPLDILENGVDADGDGLVDLKNSAPDALLSGAKMLSHLGWRSGEPWLQEVIVPDQMDWSITGSHQTRPVSEWEAMGILPREGELYQGVDAAIILPEGHKGPAFIAYPNFNVYYEWNQSNTYVLTAAYFATRLEGAAVYDAGNPAPALTGEELKELQALLETRGHDVGGVDGILGLKTRKAVQHEQNRLGLPADAWPTKELLLKL